MFFCFVKSLLNKKLRLFFSNVTIQLVTFICHSCDNKKRGQKNNLRQKGQISYRIYYKYFVNTNKKLLFFKKGKIVLHKSYFHLNNSHVYFYVLQGHTKHPLDDIFSTQPNIKNSPIETIFHCCGICRGSTF